MDLQTLRNMFEGKVVVVTLRDQGVEQKFRGTCKRVFVNGSGDVSVILNDGKEFPSEFSFASDLFTPVSVAGSACSGGSVSVKLVLSIRQEYARRLEFLKQADQVAEELFAKLSASVPESCKKLAGQWLIVQKLEFGLKTKLEDRLHWIIVQEPQLSDLYGFNDFESLLAAAEKWKQAWSETIGINIVDNRVVEAKNGVPFVTLEFYVL